MRILIAAFAACFAVPAFAANCLPHDDMVALLADQHAEQRIAAALTGNRMLMEMFSSAAGTWTMIITAPNGLACMVAAGDTFETYPLPVAGVDG